MNKPKVSVVIPVYNTELYLQDAIESIINQTLTDIEIIAINDGSTDNSLAILQQIGEKDKRLRIYSQINQGQSVARNKGINMAVGEFIYFFDSDDLLEKEALCDCYQKATEQACDIVFFDASVINDKQPQQTKAPAYQRKELVIDQCYTGYKLLGDLMTSRKFSASPCLNFIRSSYLQSIQLLFYPGIIHEDQLFTFLLYLQATRIYFLPKDYFKRRIRNHSTMTSPISMHNMDGYITVCEQLKIYKKNNQQREYNKLINKQIRDIVENTASTAIVLPFFMRMQILKRLLYSFVDELQIKSVILLLLPCLKQKK